MQILRLLAPQSAPPAHELFEPLVDGSRFRLERIISTGQATPPGEWYDQDSPEWVVLLTGVARLRFADPDELFDLRPGDALNIPAHRRHRVDWTAPDVETIWLALHYQPAGSGTNSVPVPSES
ncbi:MAG TPA: cupin [Planctomycetaceae bacterium]|nr:cupin [Planctomycetaceae bacterium]